MTALGQAPEGQGGVTESERDIEGVTAACSP